MRSEARRGCSKANAVRISKVVGAMATSSVLCGFGTSEKGDAMMHLMVSNCLDRNDDTVTLQMLAAVEKPWTAKMLETLLQIEKWNGPSEKIDKCNGPIKEFHVAKLDDFISADVARSACRCLTKVMKKSNCAFTVHYGERSRYPLKQLLDDTTNERPLRWFKQLRDLSFSEFEIAHLGPELLLESSRHYRDGQNLRQAIRNSLHPLSSLSYGSESIKSTFPGVDLSRIRHGLDRAPGLGIHSHVSQRKDAFGYSVPGVALSRISQEANSLLSKVKTEEAILNCISQPATPPVKSHSKGIPPVAAIEQLKRGMKGKRTIYTEHAARTSRYPSDPPHLGDVDPPYLGNEGWEALPIGNEKSCLSERKRRRPQEIRTTSPASTTA